MAERMVVEIDEDLRDLIPGFLTRKRADVAAISEALTRRDYAEVSRVAHRLIGEGGSYGFQSITEMGRMLEQAAAVRDDRKLTALARQLLSYLDRLEIVYQQSSD